MPLWGLCQPKGLARQRCAAAPRARAEARGGYILYLISNPIQRDGGTYFFICQGPAQTLQPLLYAE